MIASQKVSSFNEQCLSNIAWAFATVGRDDASLFDALAEAALPRVSSFSVHGISIYAWSFAKVGRNDALLFDALAQAALVEVGSFNEQGLQPGPLQKSAGMTRGSLMPWRRAQC